MKWYYWLIIASIIFAFSIFAIIKLLPFISMLKIFNGQPKYTKLSTEQLLVLSDEELPLSVLEILDKKYDYYEDCSQALSSMNDIELTVLSLIEFDMELQNGGLCQYFSNSSRFTAPYLQNALNKIGAIKINELLTQFITDNNVNLRDLENFAVVDVSQYIENTKLLPFEGFDNKYYELYSNENFAKLLANYIRDNISTFK